VRLARASVPAAQRASVRAAHEFLAPSQQRAAMLDVSEIA